MSPPDGRTRYCRGWRQGIDQQDGAFADLSLASASRSGATPLGMCRADQPRILLPPRIEGRFADPGLAAHLANRRPSLGLLQYDAICASLYFDLFITCSIT